MNIALDFLSLVGRDVEASTVEFSSSVTVIRGPSDTGKSFIVDLIDYALGAKGLREIPHSRGYEYVLLGLRFEDGDSVTLSRPLGSGRIGVYEGRWFERPEAPPEVSLGLKHSADSEENISRFLLARLGLEGARVRRNVRNATDSLSFRDIAHLCIIDETKMQSDTAPPLSERPISNTKEMSVFKVLLQGEDDRELEEVPETREVRRLNGAKFEVLDRLIGGLEARIAATPDRNALQDQLARLTLSIEQHTSSVKERVERRDALIAQSSETETRLANLRESFEANKELRARFELLDAQYRSDLSRLELLAEAGGVLGMFREADCPLCGAAPEHRQSHVSVLASVDDATAIDGESQKIHQLLSELGQTQEDILSMLRGTKAEHDSLLEVRQSQKVELEELEEAFRPERSQLRSLLQTKGEVDRAIDAHNQIADLARLRAQIADETSREVAEMASTLSLTAIREFSEEIARRLQAWGVPGGDSARFDRNERDILLEDQTRSSHGKGVRSILHAAFTVALADYCAERSLPHPGFIVLDSPLVTYRGPDDEVIDVESGEVIARNVADAFYRDIQSSFSGQIVVMENTDSDFPALPGTVDIKYTKSRTSGRYGFLPVRSLPLNEAVSSD